jgi:membrane protein DedA with SNARE-associated domain
MLASLLATTEIGTTGILIAVAVLALLEDSVGLGAILPAETVVVAAGAAAAHDMVPLWAVFVVAWAFGTAGDCVGFGIGRRWGRELLDRYGPSVGLTPDRRQQADDVVERWGWWAVAGGRQLPAIRVLVMPTTGATTMRWQIFVMADVAGVAAWAALHATIGYVVGIGLKHATDASMVVGVILLVAAGAGGAWWWQQRKGEGGTDAAPAEDAEAEASAPEPEPAEAEG